MQPENSNKSPPIPPKDWRSSSDLNLDRYAGGARVLNRKLAALRLTLIGDISAAGIAEAEAEAIVDRNLIGIRKRWRGRPTLYASPEALALLDLHRTASPAPSDWSSGSAMRKAYIGDNEDIDRKLRDLRSSLIGDITAAGIAEAEAEAIVDHNLIGIRLARTREAYHGSPDALKMMEREGQIKERDNFASEFGKKDMTSNSPKRSR